MDGELLDELLDELGTKEAYLISAESLDFLLERAKVPEAEIPSVRIRSYKKEHP